MGYRLAYDISTPWDDPFERLPNRRGSERCPYEAVISVRVQVPGEVRSLVGPARGEDLSLSGLLALTKHRLEAGQKVTLSVPTEELGLELCLPDAFIGSAHVVRIDPVEGRLVKAAFEFDGDLRSNMDFAVFVNALQQGQRN